MGAERKLMYGDYDMSQAPDHHEILKEVLIALGSNAESVWGDPTVTVQKASLRIAEVLGNKVNSSAIYATPAFPAGAGPDFSNAVIRIGTNLPADRILALLHQIEAEAGRERLVRWGQRTLDLDLLAVGDQVLPDRQILQDWIDLDPARQAEIAPDTLILPHPRLQDRSFVLVPMADVAPEWVHPVLGQTVEQMRDARPADEVATVRRL